MTDAPEQIWWNCGVGPYSFASSVKFAGGTEYIRADVAHAMVAAAYEAAAQACGDDAYARGLPDQLTACAEAIRALTPDDARAALARMMAERAATKVKPLVWGEGQGKAVHAKSSVGLYVVYTCSGTMTGKFNPCLNAVGIGPGPRRVCDSLADAKAAAQADYERRIREALG